MNDIFILYCMHAYIYILSPLCIYIINMGSKMCTFTVKKKQSAISKNDYFSIIFIYTKL